MQSFKSSIFNFVLRNRHLLQFKLKRESFDMNTSIQGFRELCEKSAAKMSKIPKGIEIQSILIAGMKAEWIKPAGANEDKVVLYLHGGGYVSGSCNDHRGFVSKFARFCGYNCLQFEYRLAPEHPFPAALEDSVAAYKTLLDSGKMPENILFAGESAGGGLVLATLLSIKAQCLPNPKGAVVISPWTDLACTSESYKTKHSVSLAPANSWNVFSKHYVVDNDPKIPLISPLYGNLDDLPAIFINAGDSDELYDEAEKFYLKAKDSGVDARFRRGEKMVHCYPLLAPLFPEATNAMEEICCFIREMLS